MGSACLCRLSCESDPALPHLVTAGSPSASPSILPACPSPNLAPPSDCVSRCQLRAAKARPGAPTESERGHRARREYRSGPGGGVGERFYPLTKERAKPAVYFGGPYRIIDFTLSNCINWGCGASSSRSNTSRCRSAVTPHGMERRRRRARRVHRDQARRSGSAKSGIRAPPTRSTRTASILRENPKQLIVLSGDHVYKMDYARMLQTHWSAAGATLAVIEVPSEEASRFGVLQVGEGNRITGFLESRNTCRLAIRCWRRWVSTSSTCRCWCQRSRSAPASRIPRTTSARTSSRAGFRRSRSTPTASTTRTRRTAKYWRDIGTLMRTTKPTWISAM